MTEQEYKLQRQVYELQMLLSQTQAQLCQANYNEAQRNLAALGDKPPDPPA